MVSRQLLRHCYGVAGQLLRHCYVVSRQLLGHSTAELQKLEQAVFDMDVV